jgi:excisionase family DNA binding protein
VSHGNARVYERVRLEPLLTVNDVAAVLSVTRRTVYRLVHKQELHPTRVEERLRFEPADIRAYLERHREPAPGGGEAGGRQAA